MAESGSRLHIVQGVLSRCSVLWLAADLTPQRMQLK